MHRLIYIEEEVADHPRTKAICDRFPKATKIYCKYYGEVFNRKGQNFRLQKQQPALILARKHKRHVLNAPDGYGIGGRHNYYFSHMLNCVYDCRYCFLQGMYRSANYVIFVNYEDFQQAIIETAAQHPNEETWFFSGYDCDSLAYEPVTDFTQEFLPTFAQLPNAYLELRTKSLQIRTLLKSEPIKNCVVAYSFTPDEISKALEHGVPSVEKRIEAMIKLQQHGWRLGLRFDPMIYQDGFEENYKNLFEQIFSRLPAECIHSVSLGTFRTPKAFHQNMVNLYPKEKLFAGRFDENRGMITYQKELEVKMTNFCYKQLMQYIPQSLFFACTPPE
ncbi:MAG: hypothetical protein COB33_010960 [Thiotrichaceae bacterium]|nr:hypothetical protein [Thiotrichaceae bacterium]